MAARAPVSIQRRNPPRRGGRARRGSRAGPAQPASGRRDRWVATGQVADAPFAAQPRGGQRGDRVRQRHPGCGGYGTVRRRAGRSGSRNPGRRAIPSRSPRPPQLGDIATRGRAEAGRCAAGSGTRPAAGRCASGTAWRTGDRPDPWRWTRRATGPDGRSRRGDLPGGHLVGVRAAQGAANQPVDHRRRAVIQGPERSQITAPAETRADAARAPTRSMRSMASAGSKRPEWTSWAMAATISRAVAALHNTPVGAGSVTAAAPGCGSEVSLGMVVTARPGRGQRLGGARFVTGPAPRPATPHPRRGYAVPARSRSGTSAVAAPPARAARPGPAPRVAHRGTTTAAESPRRSRAPGTCGARASTSRRPPARARQADQHVDGHRRCGTDRVARSGVEECGIGHQRYLRDVSERSPGAGAT